MHQNFNVRPEAQKLVEGNIDKSTPRSKQKERFSEKYFSGKRNNFKK